MMEAGKPIMKIRIRAAMTACLMSNDFDAGVPLNGNTILFMTNHITIP